jgi:hypothetical protein
MIECFNPPFRRWGGKKYRKLGAIQNPAKNETNPPLGGQGGKANGKNYFHQGGWGAKALAPLCRCALVPLSRAPLRRYTFLKNPFGILSIRF